MVHDVLVRITRAFRGAAGALLLVILCAASLHAQRRAHPGKKQQAKRVDAAATALAATYDAATGLFKGTGWWNSANGITALANVSRERRTTRFDTVYSSTFDAAQHKFPGFLNEFYDDEGWWALAWLNVYELHHEARYLAMAQSIFTDMSGGWSETCGGGIWWKKNERYKNAIANELFFSVAVRLAQLGPADLQAQYLGWARREERWFLASGMINADSLVNDGLDANCQNNHRTTWTYNQGVVLTGLVGMSALTGDSNALGVAEQIAASAAQHLTDKDGVFHDPCEPDCGADGIQFKGVLLRNLVALPRTADAAVAHVVEVNADSVWTHARTPTDHFSVVWSGPPADSGTGSLISALDALTAQLTLQQVRAK